MAEYELERVYVFKFAKGIQSGTAITPFDDMLVHIGADVMIAKDSGVPIPFTIGDKIVLGAGSLYEFSEDIPLGIGA